MWVNEAGELANFKTEAKSHKVLSISAKGSLKNAIKKIMRGFDKTNTCFLLVESETVNWLIALSR